MKHTFHPFDMSLIKQSAYRAFDCEERAVRGPGNRKQRERDKDRKRVDKVAERFFDLMNGPNPPTDIHQALPMILPVWWLLLNVLWSEFAKRVAIWLWERTQNE